MSARTLLPHSDARRQCHVTWRGIPAFLRQGNPDVGEFDDAVILRTFGEGPDGLGLT